MTSPNTDLKTLAAKLLFVLCKENRKTNKTKQNKRSNIEFILVNRFVKYTGFGNAAGLIHDLGLHPSGQNNHLEQYSSDSDESDTEVYKNYRENYE